MEIQREVLEAPLPILAGMLHPPHDSDLSSVVFEEGMLIDLTHPSKVLYYQGDESTILPTSCYKTLKTALQMETSKNKDREQDIRTRNLMISEAFLRFFVDILEGIVHKKLNVETKPVLLRMVHGNSHVHALYTEYVLDIPLESQPEFNTRPRGYSPTELLRIIRRKSKKSEQIGK
ncbi:unnamed protein product [Spodoptera littoralis]|uniref:Uncharacterized protein n=1 Tax=Spodoptera littoralis TaxID=7109 RepID=A0A9P0N4J9_SPOLI|nr:unnamed protein product [Spodoptera littoralis]CAH1642212.1 unnamed protein product [Spodoptera littoralis]